jgi:RNA polymerase sigma factor (sigma-70 family)
MRALAARVCARAQSCCDQRVSEAETRSTVNAVFRRESARLIAALTRIVRDVGLAEELAQDALVAALEQWPRAGVPDQPGAWLMAVAKHRALNHLRHTKLVSRKHAEIGQGQDELGAQVAADMESSLDDEIGDDVLRLVFTACHPLLSSDARVALTLRMIGGLTTDEIARAFLVSESTVAQRIVRAKRNLAEARVPFEVPRGEELSARLAAVLGVIYLIFNEGYAASAGDDCMRPALCDEALRLGRLLAQLAPGEPEVHGLSALLQLNASRTPARTDASGEPVLLRDQDRTRWDHALIAAGLGALALAEALAAARGSYTLQAAISACHARAARAEETDWARIAALYTELLALTPSPVVALNRAVAVSMAEGPAAGLALLEPLRHEPALRNYHLLPSARADLLFRLGRRAEARAEFERAAQLTANTRQRARLLERASACALP